MTDEIDDEEEEEDGWSRPAYHDGTLRIMKERCSTCVFRPGNKMDLHVGRLADLVATVRAGDSHVTCHKVLGTGQPGVICKGSDEMMEGQAARMGRRLGIMREMTEEEVLAEGRDYQEGKRR